MSIVGGHLFFREKLLELCIMPNKRLLNNCFFFMVSKNFLHTNFRLEGTGGLIFNFIMGFQLYLSLLLFVCLPNNFFFNLSFENLALDQPVIT